MEYQNPIETNAAAYQYEDGGMMAVDHVTLSVPKGAFVAVLGHNGSGKSTLAKLMNALYLPTEGSVVVCGLDTAHEEHLWDVRKHAGMVFQNPDNQIVATVVRDDVAFGLENLGVPQAEMLPRIDDALAAVRMTDFASAAPYMLSGGQKQRVAVAGVLAMQPDVMILDEATAMLDPPAARKCLAPCASSTATRVLLWCGLPTSWRRPRWPTVWWCWIMGRSRWMAPPTACLPRWSA